MANPPITIGPFNDVPAPGSPIRSSWPQSMSSAFTAMGKGVKVSLPAADTNPSPGQVRRVDVPIAFGAAPYTGVAVVVLNLYAGFTAGGSISAGLYSDAIPAPSAVGGGFVTRSAAVTNPANAWSALPSLSLGIPVTKAAQPIVQGFVEYTNNGCYVYGFATIIYTPGPPAALP